MIKDRRHHSQDSQGKRTTFRLLVLPVAVGLAMSSVTTSFAMTSLEDSELSQVSGADGINLQVTADSIDIDSVYTTDDRGDSATGGVAATDVTRYSRYENISMTGLGGQVGADIQIQTGADVSGSTGVKVDMALYPVRIVSTRLQNCGAATGSSDCNQLLGEVAVALPSGLNIGVATTGGVFNESGTAFVDISLEDGSVFFTQTGSDGKESQLVMSDMRAKIEADGKLWIDSAEGLRFFGTVNLPEKTTAGYAAGIQAGIYHRGDVGAGGANASDRYDAPTSGGITRVGFSGQLNDVDVRVRGTNETDPDTSGILGRVNGEANGDSIIGSNGLAVNIRAKVDADNFSYEIGEAGAAGNSVRFSNLVPFAKADVVEDSEFDLGDLYLNAIKSTKVGIPLSDRLEEAMKFNAVETSLDDGSGFNYLNIYTTDKTTLDTSNGTSLAWRGLQLQSLPRTTQIIDNSTGAISTTLNGSLLTLLNAANLNIILAGMDDDKIKFGAGFSTQGLSDDYKATTIIGLADTAQQRYFGFRNIDLLLQTAGTIDLTADSINFVMPHLLLAFDGELAVGDLMTSTNGKNFSSDTAVTGNSKQDVLFGVRARLNAEDVTFKLYPSNAGDGLGLTTELNLPREPGDRLQTGQNTTASTGTRTRKAGSFVQIEAVDGSVFGLENISGRVALLGADATTSPAARLDVTDNTVSLEGKLLINGTRDAAGVRTWGDQATDLRIGNLNFYPQGDMSSPQRLGEVAIPGGELYSKLTLTLE